MRKAKASKLKRSKHETPVYMDTIQPVERKPQLLMIIKRGYEQGTREADEPDLCPEDFVPSPLDDPSSSVSTSHELG